MPNVKITQDFSYMSCPLCSFIKPLDLRMLTIHMRLKHKIKYSDFQTKSFMYPKNTDTNKFKANINLRNL